VLELPLAFGAQMALDHNGPNDHRQVFLAAQVVVPGGTTGAVPIV